MAYPNAVFSAFAFAGFLMCSIPLPWHLEGKHIRIIDLQSLDLRSSLAWNTGTCLYMLWTGTACLIQFVNSIVWNGNAINWAPVWCDICMFRFINLPPVPHCFLSHQAYDWNLIRDPGRFPLHQSPSLPDCICEVRNDYKGREASNCHY